MKKNNLVVMKGLIKIKKLAVSESKIQLKDCKIETLQTFFESMIHCNLIEIRLLERILESE